MSDTLTRAANAAAEALGMKVDVFDVPERDEDGIRTHCDPLVFIQVWGTLDKQNIPTTDLLCDVEALAYLEGLECGARIMRERQASLITYFRYVVQELHDIYGPDGPENKNDDSYLYAAENALLDFDGKL